MNDTGSSSLLYEWLIESVNQMPVSCSGSVKKWLEDIRLMTDMECMCVLQGKSLGKETSDVVFTSSKSTKDSIDAIRGRAHVISSEFSKLFKRLEKEKWKQVRSGAIRITCHIRSLLHECNSSMEQQPPPFAEQQHVVMEECAKLAQFVESNLDVNGHTPHKVSLVQLLTYLGQSFSSLVDTVLGHMIKMLILSLQTTQSEYLLRSTLNNLVQLGLDGDHMCYLIAREGGIHTMLDLCKNKNLSSIHAQSLRAIATACCVTESVIEMEKVAGVSALSSILSDLTTPENIRAEAAGVIAQITSPAMDHYQHLGGFLENMEDLVKSLTVLCVEASCHEVFLLGSAALANITFMDPLACDFLLQFRTAQGLIEACQLSKDESLFAKDQVATVLANMAGVESCSYEITRHSGIELLLQFLHEHLPGVSTEAEMAACERVQQKAAIALARLSKDAENAQIIVELGGIPRLAQLCRDPKERNHSDAVLVAALAALRKICSVCGLSEFDTPELRKLVQPKLMDSFMYCSGMEESFV